MVLVVDEIGVGAGLLVLAERGAHVLAHEIRVEVRVAELAGGVRVGRDGQRCHAEIHEGHAQKRHVDLQKIVVAQGPVGHGQLAAGRPIQGIHELVHGVDAGGVQQLGHLVDDILVELAVAGADRHGVVLNGLLGDRLLIGVGAFVALGWLALALGLGRLFGIGIASGLSGLGFDRLGLGRLREHCVCGAQRQDGAGLLVGLHGLRVAIGLGYGLLLNRLTI